MLDLLIEFVFFIIKTMSNIIITPIQLLLETAFPDLGTLITNCEGWLSEYGFRYLLFAKKSFMNLLAFPQALFSLIIGYIIIKIGLHVSMQVYRFGINIYNKFKI